MNFLLFILCAFFITGEYYYNSHSPLKSRHPMRMWKIKGECQSSIVSMVTKKKDQLILLIVGKFFCCLDWSAFWTVSIGIIIRFNFSILSFFLITNYNSKLFDWKKLKKNYHTLTLSLPLKNEELIKRSNWLFNKSIDRYIWYWFRLASPVQHANLWLQFGIAPQRLNIIN